MTIRYRGGLTWPSGEGRPKGWYWTPDSEPIPTIYPGITFWIGPFETEAEARADALVGDTVEP